MYEVNEVIPDLLKISKEITEEFTIANKTVYRNSVNSIVIKILGELRRVRYGDPNRDMWRNILACMGREQAMYEPATHQRSYVELLKNIEMVIGGDHSHIANSGIMYGHELRYY